MQSCQQYPLLSRTTSHINTVKNTKVPYIYIYIYIYIYMALFVKCWPGAGKIRRQRYPLTILLADTGHIQPWSKIWNDLIYCLNSPKTQNCMIFWTHILNQRGYYETWYIEYEQWMIRLNWWKTQDMNKLVWFIMHIPGIVQWWVNKDLIHCFASSGWGVQANVWQLMVRKAVINRLVKL